MQLAIQEAQKGLGWVLPNPPVGCVIVDKDHRLLATGHHKKYGQSHAEIEALKKIKDKKFLKKASMYVTLEPCAHKGQTGSCVQAILKHPLKAVIYGDKDPNPKTFGKSLKLLKQKGLFVKKFSFFTEDIQKLYEVFSFNMKFQKTFVALKVASSMDGMLAFSSGKSQWISDQKARNYVSYLRGCYDGVLIGRDTFLKDRPRLNPRHPLFKGKTNKVVILDPEGHCEKLISGSQLASLRKPTDIFLVSRKKLKTNGAFKSLKADTLPQEDGAFDLNELLIRLYQEFQINSLMLEGGAGIFSSFLKQNQIQRIYQFISPVLMGGVKGRSWTESLSLKKIKKVLIRPEYSQIGESFLITGLYAPFKDK